MSTAIAAPTPAQVRHKLPRGFKPLDRPWPTIQERYEAGEPPSALAREYDMNLTTLVMRAKREHWLKPKQLANDTSLRTTLKQLHAVALDKLPEPTTKNIGKHADTLFTLTRSAALVEGWDAQTGGSIINLAVVQVRNLSPAELANPDAPAIDVQATTDTLARPTIDALPSDGAGEATPLPQ